MPYCRSADVECLAPLAPSGWVDYRPDAMRQHRRTARPGDLARFRRPKVVVARMGRALVATADDRGTLIKDAMLLSREDDSLAALRLLAGLVSSKHVSELYATQFVTIDVLKNALLSLPLPGSLDALLETAEGEEIVDLVEHLMDGGADGAGRSARQIRLNFLVAELYSRLAE